MTSESREGEGSSPSSGGEHIRALSCFLGEFVICTGQTDRSICYLPIFQSISLGEFKH